MITATIVYHSKYRGNTEALARSVATGLRRVDGADVAIVSVDAIDDHWKRLNASDTIVLGCPTYIGSLTSNMKAFMEQCAGEIWLKRAWLGKVAGGFTVSSGRSGDKLNCLNQLFIFACQLGMTWVPVPITGGNYSTQGSEDDLNRMAGYIGVMAQANIDQPAAEAMNPSDHRTAEIYGAHIATVTRELKAGRAALKVNTGPVALDDATPKTLFDLMN